MKTKEGQIRAMVLVVLILVSFIAIVQAAAVNNDSFNITERVINAVEGIIDNVTLEVDNDEIILDNQSLPNQTIQNETINDAPLDNQTIPIEANNHLDMCTHNKI